MADFLELPAELRRFIAPNAPAKAEAVRFDAKANGCQRTFQAGLWNEGFLSDSQQFSLRIYCTSDGASFYKAGSFPLFSPEISQVPPERLIRRATIAIESDNLGILVPLDESAHVILRPQSTHLVVGDEAVELEQHDQKLRTQFWELSHAQHFARVRADFQNSDSLSSFARRWLELSREGRESLILRCEVGNVDDIIRLHKNLAVVGYHTHELLELGRFVWYWHHSAAPAYSNAIEFFQKWRNAILEHFRPALLCRPDVPEWVRSFHTPQMVCEIPTPPTAHEIVEAQLFLSEWVRQNCPEKAAELLVFPT